MFSLKLFKTPEKLTHNEERMLERWIKKKSIFQRPTKLDKFSETGWRWLYYSSIFAYGLVIVVF